MAIPEEHVDRFLQDPRHLDWLTTTSGRDRVRWRIPFSHHPAYCAGQSHLVVVELDENEARLSPVSGLRNNGQPQQMTALTPGNEVVYPSVTVPAG